MVDLPERVPRPTTDLTLIEQLGVFKRLPGGGLGDLGWEAAAGERSPSLLALGGAVGSQSAPVALLRRRVGNVLAPSAAS